MQIILTILLAFLLQKGVHAKGCPSSSDEWQSQLTTMAKSIIPELGNNALYKRGPKLLPLEKYQKVLDFWDNCHDYVNESITQKFNNITKHSRFMVKAQASGHSGFKTRDEDYLLTSLSKNRNFASLPKVFFKDDYLPSNWKTILQACHKTPKSKLCREILQWKIIEFYSTLEDGSGHHRRVIIQIPHKNFQQYLLFFPEHPEHQKTKLVDIIALQTHDLKTHTALNKVKPHFFERHKSGFAKDGGRCISCHPNGLREIYPIQGSLIDPLQAKTIAAFNQKVRAFGKPDWQGYIDDSSLGPPLGKSCIKCHSHEKSRSALTLFTSPSLIRSKILEHEMPRPDLFRPYFKLIQSLPYSLDNESKKRIQKIALSYKAIPGQDYRDKKQIRRVRSKLLGELLRQGHISYLKYVIIKSLDLFVSFYTNYKLDLLFSEYRSVLHHWLLGTTLLKNER